MQRRPSETENKLFMLYAIDRLGPVTAQQLLLFMVQNDFMDYISMQLGLAELDEAGLLRKRKHALGTLYALTGKGRDALSMFRTRIPHSRLAQIDMIAGDWRLQFMREKQMLADFEKKENGNYLVHLRLLEYGEDILDMRLSVPTHEAAQRFCDVWIAQAGGIYTYIMRTLGEAGHEAKAQ